VSSCDDEVNLVTFIAFLLVVLAIIITAYYYGVEGFKTLLLIMLTINFIGLGYWIARWNYEGGCYCRSYGSMILSTITNIVFILAVYYLLAQ